MKRLIATSALVAALLVSLIGGTSSAEPARTGGTVAVPACAPGLAARLAARAYAPDRWAGEPAHALVRRARAAGWCGAGAAAVAKQRHQFYRYRRYRRAAPYRGPQCRGPKRPGDKCWWAIPWRIVCGESGGDFTPDYGEGVRDGAYQLIPSSWAQYGDPRWAYPSEAPPLAQHVAAARLRDDPAGSGLGAWYGLC